MSLEKNVLGIVPGLQATALTAQNLKFVNKSLKIGPKSSKAKPMKPGSFLKMGMTNLVGIGLIGATAKSINQLP